MKNKSLLLLITLSIFFVPTSEIWSQDLKVESKGSKDPINSLNQQGSYYSGIYKDYFIDLLNKSQEKVNSKIDSVFEQLFYGDDKTQRIYYPVGPDMAYIQDIWNDDVRTEGMSYGMMITVQLDKKNEFDRIWKWAKTFMQHQNGQSKDYFAWHAKTSGEILDSNSASDGEEWFVMALFFASKRWGDGEGIYNYKAEAQKILDAMLNKVDSSDSKKVVTNIFNKKEKQVVFVPSGEADDFTDPSYHLPHYYELWARWGDKANKFWCDAATVSRKFLKKVVNQKTGLAPDYATFDGKPFSSFNRNTNNFQFDAWRVAMNVSIDYQWFAKDEWAVTQSNRLLNFFYSQGLRKYGNVFTLEGKMLGIDHSAGLVAMNAVAAITSTNEHKKEFVEELWNLHTPSGRGRYYDGLLYMMALLQVSGNYRIYDSTNNCIPSCSSF
jgi:oligosaccharide reducing-end xylanase